MSQPTFHVPLTEIQTRLLAQGVLYWHGPTRCSEELAAAMGFKDVRDLLDEGERIAGAIEAASRLSRLDWERALMATEIGWSCTLFGAPFDWEIVTPFSHSATLKILEEVRSAIRNVVRHVDWPDIGTQPVKDAQHRVISRIKPSA